MRRHKAWRGGSKAQRSCDPATALGSLPFVHKMIRQLGHQFSGDMRLSCDSQKRPLQEISTSNHKPKSFLSLVKHPHKDSPGLQKSKNHCKCTPKKSRGPVLRPARLRARGRLGARESPREHLGGSRKLCGVSREIWEDCRRFWNSPGWQY